MPVIRKLLNSYFRKSIKYSWLINKKLCFPNVFLIRSIHTVNNSPITTSNLHSNYQKSKQLNSCSLNDNFISCTTINVNGDIENMSRKYPKMDFLKKLDLYPRDLRKIDNSSIDNIPTITVRTNCILINLLHIKSIIMKDKIMIFDTSDVISVQKLSLFIYELQDKLKVNLNQNTSFEFKALESILINVMGVLENDLKFHVTNCTNVLNELENQIDRDKLRDLLIYSKSLTNYCQKTSLIRNVLDELLENDDDLKGMYLTNSQQPNPSIKIKGIDDIIKSDEVDYISPLDDFNFNEIEILLENYYTQSDEFVQQATSLISDIKSTEEIVTIILDSNRNSLMLYDLKITIYTLGITIATLVPAFYGMNLKNFIEDSPYGFSLVVGLSMASALGITIINFNKLRMVQQLTMTLGGSDRKNELVLKQSNLKNVGKNKINERYKLKSSSVSDWQYYKWLMYFRNVRFLKNKHKHKKLDVKDKILAWKWLIDQRQRK